MNGACDQFLAGTRFAEDQHRGIGGSHARHGREYRLQRWRGSHNLLEHQPLVDLFAQSEILFPNTLLRLLLIFDLSGRGIPTLDVSLLIEQRIHAQEQPAIQAIPTPHSRLHFEGGAGCKTAPPIGDEFVDVIGMNGARTRP